MADTFLQWFDEQVDHRLLTEEEVKQRLFKEGWRVDLFRDAMAKVGQRSEAMQLTGQGEVVPLSLPYPVFELVVAISRVLGMKENEVLKVYRSYLPSQ